MHGDRAQRRGPFEAGATAHIHPSGAVAMDDQRQPPPREGRAAPFRAEQRSARACAGPRGRTYLVSFGVGGVPLRSGHRLLSDVRIRGRAWLPTPCAGRARVSAQWGAIQPHRYRRLKCGLPRGPVPAGAPRRPRRASSASFSGVLPVLRWRPRRCSCRSRRESNIVPADPDRGPTYRHRTGRRLIGAYASRARQSVRGCRSHAAAGVRDQLRGAAALPAEQARACGASRLSVLVPRRHVFAVAPGCRSVTHCGRVVGRRPGRLHGTRRGRWPERGRAGLARRWPAARRGVVEWLAGAV
jgi:hypothetical protein